VATQAQLQGLLNGRPKIYLLRNESSPGKSMRKNATLLDDPEDIVTLAQAAKIIGVSAGTAWAWAIRGKLPAQLVAGRYLVRRSDAEELQLESAAV
jgi:Helix-turn-helix domain